MKQDIVIVDELRIKINLWLKKPDIVIVDKITKSVHIFELIVPGEAWLVITLKKPDIVILDKGLSQFIFLS